MTGTNSYSFHSLHIQDEDTNFYFDLQEYLTSDEDYFESFFGKTSSFLDNSLIVKNRKWSKFNKGDFTLPNQTLFRGIKFNISNIDSLEISENSIDNLNLNNSNNFDGWKFSILLDSEFITTTTTTSTTTTVITSTTTISCDCARVEYSVINNDSDNPGYYTYEDCGGATYESVEIEPNGSITVCACEDTLVADMGYELSVIITPIGSC
jgi:hypothetical protein